MPIVGTAIEALARTVFPPTCAICGQAYRGDAPLCEDCACGLDRLRAQPACPRCAASPGPHLSATGRCGQCRARPFHFDGATRTGPFVDQLVEVVHQFKYHSAEYLDRFLSNLMKCALGQAPWQDQIEAIIPVPSHWTRRFTDGYYPVQTLAKQVARQVQLPYLPILRRVRFDCHQIGLNYVERIRNVQGAFAVAADVTIDGACVCVLDDVMTSCATLNESAKMLKDAGASQVYVLVLARAGRQDATLGLA